MAPFNACIPKDIIHKTSYISSVFDLKACETMLACEFCILTQLSQMYYKDPDPYYTHNSSSSHRAVINSVHHTVNIVHIRGAA